MYAPHFARHAKTVSMTDGWGCIQWKRNFTKLFVLFSYYDSINIFYYSLYTYSNGKCQLSSSGTIGRTTPTSIGTCEWLGNQDGTGHPIRVAYAQGCADAECMATEGFSTAIQV